MATQTVVSLRRSSASLQPLDTNAPSTPTLSYEVSGPASFMSLSDLAAQTLNLENMLAQHQQPYMPAVSNDMPQPTNQPSSSASTEQDTTQTAVAELIGIMPRDENAENEGYPDIQVAPLDDTDTDTDKKEAPSTADTPPPTPNAPVTHLHPHPHPQDDDISKLLAEKAPSLLSNADLIRDLFKETYAKALATPQQTADPNSHQMTTSQAPQKQPPAVAEPTRAPQPEQLAPARGDSVPRRSEATTTNEPRLDQIMQTSGNLDSRLSEARTTNPPRLDRIVSTGGNLAPRHPDTRTTNAPRLDRIMPTNDNLAPPRPEARTTRPPPLALIVPASSNSLRGRLPAVSTVYPPQPQPQPTAPARGIFARPLHYGGLRRCPRGSAATGPPRGNFSHPFARTGNTSPTTPRREPTTPTTPVRDRSAPRLSAPITPPAQTAEIDNAYFADGDDYDTSDDYESDESDMSDSDAPLDEIVVWTDAQEPVADTDTMPDAQRTNPQAAQPAPPQGSGTSNTTAAPSLTVRKDLLAMLHDPNLPSEIYKSLFLGFLRALQRDEEKLKNAKDPREARDMELQALLLKTDIEKQRILLKAQVAYEEATDGEEFVVLGDTRPFATPGSDGCYGFLPRPSTIMMRTCLRLGDELNAIKAEMEGKDGEDDSQAKADKTVRMENLKFFVEEFFKYYHEDVKKEKETRKQREEHERANPPKKEPRVRYPTPMIHDKPKTVPPPGIHVQPPRAARASTDTPAASNQQLNDDGSDALMRGNSDRRGSRLPDRGAHQSGLDMVDEGVPSESDVSMYVGK